MTSSGTYNHWFELAKRIQGEANAAEIGRPRPKPDPGHETERTLLERFDEAVSNESLRSSSRRLMSDGHYARAVEEAFKCLNNAVKAKSGFAELDGDRLMRQAFSANGPKLRLNNWDSTSEKDEQRGYMDIFAGSMTGIRNPRAHEHELIDEPEVALELLVLANHLMRKLENSTEE